MPGLLLFVAQTGHFPKGFLPETAMESKLHQVSDPGRTCSDAGRPGSADQYNVILMMITQMLVMHRLEDRLNVLLDTITASLGFKAAAVALVDDEAGNLDMRMSVGFGNDASIQSISTPLDSGIPHIQVTRSGLPAWLSQGQTQESELISRFGYEGDLLAIPLIGGPAIGDIDLPEQHFPDPGSAQLNQWLGDTGRLPASGMNLRGILYVGASRSKADAASIQFLGRLADAVSATIAFGAERERMNSSITTLTRERQWVESIMKSVADPIVLTNLDNEILVQNRRAEELFSGSDDASEGKRRALKMNDLLFSAYLSSATVSSSDAVGRDLTLVDPIEGSDLHFEVISTPAMNELGEGIGLVSVFRDVTDLRHANVELVRNYNKLQQAESEARRERDRLNLIIENVGHPVVVSGPGGNFILFNHRAESLFRQEAVTQQGRDILLRAVEDPANRVLAAVRANSVKLTSFISGLASETRTGRKAEIEFVDPQTGSLLPMEITSVEVVDVTGQVTAVVSVLHDLSEVRELERTRLEQRLSESDKLAAVGTLAASIAHEVNNPLEAIKNALFLLQSSEDLESRSRFLGIAFKETARVSHIIRQMLGFSRRSGAVEWVDLNLLIDETLILVESKLQHSGIRVSRRLDPNLPRVHAYPDQVRQVLLNLLLNAQQSFDKAGRISIVTSKFEASQPSVCIEISDSGRGIGEDELKRIFEPFFSTRKDGTGLGLWVAQNIIRQHGGRIEVSSSLGWGSVFQVILPIDSPPLKTEGPH